MNTNAPSARLNTYLRDLRLTSRTAVHELGARACILLACCSALSMQAPAQQRGLLSLIQRMLCDGQTFPTNPFRGLAAAAAEQQAVQSNSNPGTSVSQVHVPSHAVRPFESQAHGVLQLV